MTDSESEEEILVVVEFDQSLPQPANGNTFKVIGLDSDNPIVQYQKQVFRGEWNDTVGTKVLLKETSAPDTKDPVFSVEIPQYYDYFSKTSKVLKLRPYVLNQTADETVSKPYENSEDEDQGDERGKL